MPRPLNLDWQEYHRNCWVARLTKNLSLSINRRQKRGSPWRMDIFGHHQFGESFDTASEAMDAAERRAFAFLRQAIKTSWYRSNLPSSRKKPTAK